MPIPLTLPGPLVAALLLALACAAAGADPAPFPGQPSDYRGFAKHEFTAEGQRLLVVEPKKAAPGRPWIWRCEILRS